MENIILTNHLQDNITIISNYFIDEYMIAASGDFVKVYLYLLRCCSSNSPFTVSSIADHLNYTEKDVQRALLYWQKENVLLLKNNDGNNISEIHLLPLKPKVSYANILPKEPIAEVSSLKTSPSTQPAFSDLNEIPKKKEYNPIIVEQKKPKVDPLIFASENYLKRQLNLQEINILIYLTENLNLKEELVEYLIEQTFSENKKSLIVVERLAIQCYEQKIQTKQEAKKAFFSNREFIPILKALEIYGRVPYPHEKTAFTRWFYDYHFSLDMIIEACRRGIAQTGKFNQGTLNYIEGILKGWLEAKAKSLRDVEQLDINRKLQKITQANEKAEKSKKEYTAFKPAPNRFHNFEQREYDYDAITEQLADRININV